DLNGLMGALELNPRCHRLVSGACALRLIVFIHKKHQSTNGGVSPTASLRLIATVEKAKGQRWERLRELHGDWARDMLLYLGQRSCGMKLKELAAESGLASYGAVAMAIKRYASKLARDSDEAARMNDTIQMLN